jgi:diguanylate cyclase (GGDEF)-like protein/PAS domain S-box-containing protein
VDLEHVIGTLADHTSDAILIAEAEPMDRPGPRIVWCNRAFTVMTGYGPDEIIGNTPRILQGPDTDPETRRRIRAGLKAWHPVRAQLLNYRKDGTTFWVDLSIEPVADETGWYHYWVAVQRDVTREREIALQFESANRLLRRQAMVLEHAKDIAIVTDAEGYIEWTNAEFTRHTGFGLDEVRGRKPGAFLQGRGTDPESVERMRRAIANQKQIDVELLNYSKAGTPYWVDMSIVPVKEGGRLTNFIAIERDVTVRKNQESLMQALAIDLKVRNQEIEERNAHLRQLSQQIEHTAHHDPVTGLPNRAWLAKTYSEALKHGDGALAAFDTFCVVDIDQFFLVNDAYGHDAGDEVLRCLASRLSAIAEPGSLVVRLSGDEFAIVGSFGSTDEQALAKGQRIIEAFGQPVLYKDRHLTFTCTLGVARLLPSAGLEAAENQADAALRQARQQGKRLALYTQDVAHRVEALRTFAADFPRAIAEKRFVPYFQLQVDAKTHFPVGVETLVRWRHETRGLIQPGEFLPIAGSLKLTDAIDAAVIEDAIGHFESWIQEGTAPDKISVNLQAARLLDHRFVAWLVGLQSRIGRLAIELLETSIEDELHEPILPALQELRRAGIGIEIDDFGSGRASILSLIRLKPDRIKIDRTIVPRGLADTERMEAISSVVILARTVGARVTAEGIETEEQARIVTELGADTLQGFLFGRPEPAADHFLPPASISTEATSVLL